MLVLYFEPEWTGLLTYWFILPSEYLRELLTRASHPGRRQYACL